MRSIWNNIISGWNFMKLLRVIAGIIVMTSGFNEKNGALMILGVLFLGFSLVNAGCCTTTCQPARRQPFNADVKDVEYEEMGVK